MKIAFWSEEDGCGTTSSMAAVACVCSDAWALKTILMQSRNQEGGLRRKLEGRLYLSGSVREECAYYAMDGLDHLLWQAKNEKLDQGSIVRSLIPVIKDKMYYLPQGGYRQPIEYPVQRKEAIWRVIQQAEQAADILFLDCGNGEDELTGHLLAQAEVVVVNLSQERQNLDAYFQARHVFRGRTVYIVDRYHPESVYNKKNLGRLYRLGEEELAVIPHNTFFRYASDRGRIGQFIRRHIHCGSIDHQSYFMQELIQAAHMILQAAGLLT